MLKQITWASYCYVLVILLVSYYVIVVLLQYSKKVRRILAGMQPLFFTKKNEGGTSSSFSSAQHVENDERLFAITHNLVQTLRATITEAAEGGKSKHELLKLLNSVTAEHEELKGTAFQVAVNNFISVETGIHCSINLSEEDLVAVWKKR
jgi:hypothetical protein